MDPLSDILALLRPRTVSTYGIVTGGDWAFDAARGHEGMKFGAVARGACWLRVKDQAPVRLETGDCYLLTGQPFWLGSDPSLRGIDSRLLVHDPDTRIVRHGDRDDLFMVGGHMTFDEDHARLLAGLMPPMLHIPAGSDEAAVLRWTLDQLAREIQEPRPGGLLMSDHLAHILFVTALRVHMAADGGTEPGWLTGLGDPRIRRALIAMHGDPARPWRLDALAREAGMSRTAFALRFRDLVGWPPLDYLLRWRMQLAARDLARRAPLPQVARDAGYQSDSAFSAAFKRVMGCAPKHFQMRVRPLANHGADHGADEDLRVDEDQPDGPIPDQTADLAVAPSE